MNPRREFDNLGVMACFHRRYILGDKDVPLRESWFTGWDEMENYIWDELDAVVVLPLYLYDHSGITMSTGPFHCPWDSGQVGFIYVSKDKVRREYGWKVLTKQRLAKIAEYLKNEVETYDDYLTGNVYGYVIEDNEYDVDDSCWGFYGDPKEWMIPELKIEYPEYELEVQYEWDN